MFKALKDLSVTIVENSAVEREDLRPYRKSEKIPKSLRSTSLLQISDRFY